MTTPDKTAERLADELLSKDDVTNELYSAVQKYLNAHGWNVVVIGGTGVTHDAHASKYNNQFVVKFVGAKGQAIQAIKKGGGV